MRRKVVLIADDDAELVKALTMRCNALGLDVQTAYDAGEALNRVREFEPDVICMDLKMPPGNGLAVCEMLSSHATSAVTPIILMTGEADDATIRRCHNLCVYYVQKCPNLWARIEPLICELMRVESTAVQPAPLAATPAIPPKSVDVPILPSPPTTSQKTSPSNKDECYGELLDVVFEMLGADPKTLDDDGQAASKDRNTSAESSPPWILCIDDDSEYSMALKYRLEAHGVAVVRAFEGMEGLRTAFTHPADAILLDYEMPNGQGDYILRRLKDNPVTKQLPVIVITGRRDRMLERRMLSLGAAKFMNKPPDFPELLRELRKFVSIMPQASEV